MSLAAVFDRVAEKHSQRHEGKRDNWHPSDMGWCERKSILARAGVPHLPFKTVTLRKWWMGDKIHTTLQEAVESELEVVGHEVRVKDDTFHVSGKIDTLIRKGGEFEVLEYKSVASRTFSYGNLPMWSHLLQIGCYLTFPATCPHEGLGLDCGFCGGAGKITASRGRLLYWSKDDGQIEEYLVDPTDQLAGEVKTTLQRLQKAFEIFEKDGTLPEPTKETFKHKLCEYYGTGKCCGDRPALAEKAEDGGQRRGAPPSETGKVDDKTVRPRRRRRAVPVPKDGPVHAEQHEGVRSKAGGLDGVELAKDPGKKQ